MAGLLTERDVQEFIRTEMARANEPGACCRIADRWFRRCKGFSALENFGRPIASQADVDEWLDERGGIAVGVNRVMRAAGCRKTAEPSIGDVGLIVWNDLVYMAINGGSHWFSRGDDGFVMAPAESARAAWSLR